MIEKNFFIFGTIFMLGCACYIYHVESSNREYVRNMTEPKAITKNGIGCTKYFFKGDVWWECPAEKNISSIVEQHNKHTIEVPVVGK